MNHTHDDWMQKALEAAGVGTWMLDPAENIVRCDERCRILYGLPAGERFSYQTILERVHPEDRALVNEAVRTALQGNREYNIDFRTTAESGSQQWLCCKGKAYRDGSHMKLTGTIEDISQKKGEEETLMHLERRFRAAVEYAALGIVVSDLNGKFLVVNKAFSDMVRYRQEELFQKRFQDLTHPDDLPRNQELVDQLAQGTIPAFHLTKRYLRKDGSEVWTTLDTTLIRNEAGEPEAFFSIVQDITQEREANAMQQKLLTLMENSINLMSILEADGRNSYINKAGREMLGFDSKEEVLQTPISELSPPEDYAFVEREVLPAIEQKGRWDGVMNIRHLKTGEVFPVYNSSIRIDDPQTGEPMAVGAVMRDLRPELERQAALRDSEQRFRSLIMQAPVAIGLMEGKDLVITSANEAMLQLWGKPASIIGLPLLKALPEVEGQGFVELLEGVYTSGVPYYGYETLARLERHGKMEDAYFNFVYAPLYEGERITGVMAVASEVTSQVRTKRELQESERRFRNLILEAPVATAIYVGEEMVIELANEKMIKLWGKDGSVFGKTVSEALPELEGQPFMDQLQAVYSTGVPYEASEDPADLVVEGRLQRFYFNFTYKPLHNADGQVYAILNMAVDVTALVQAKQDLLQAQDELHRAIEAAEMGTWNIHLDNNEVTFSERVREWFGFREETVNLETVLSSIHEEDRESVRQRLVAYRDPALGGIYGDEYRIVHQQNGQERIVRVVGRVFFDDGGVPYSITGTVQDITAQKMNEQVLETQVALRTEQLRKINQELERSNQELEQFAYVASHDMQEPVRKILTFSQMMQDHNQGQLDSRGAQYLEKIRSSAERMITIIRDILNYSHLGDTGKVYMATDLNEVLQNVLTDLELTITQKQATIRRDTLPVIEAIPLQMNQLFYNILNNALKFSKPGVPPEITISCQALPPEALVYHPNLRASASYVELVFTDNGIGFSQQYAQKIFAIFQRLHDRYSYGGTGIGLALCKKVVDNHQGAIFAQSEEGKGSRFHVILPVRR